MWGNNLPTNQYLDALRADPANPNLGRHFNLDNGGSVQGDRLMSTGGGASREELIEAGRQFEAYFISYLLKVMRETVPQDGLLPNKQGAHFHTFYDQEIGRRAAESGGIGLTAMMQNYVRNNLAGLPNTPQVSPVKGR